MAEYSDQNRGVLFPNDRKEKDTHPDYKGKGNYGGVEFEIAAWKRTSQNGKPRLSISFKEPYRKPEQMDDVEF